MTALRHIPVELTIFGGTLSATVPVPDGPATPRDLLPVFMSIGEAVIHLSVKSVERDGKSVSCRAGCAACCRQLAPISEAEARALIRLVEAMPEPRRTWLMRRFSQAARKIDAAGLRDRLMTPQTQPRESLKTVGIEYFHARIECPFLEDDRCSIHPDRPMVCREYLVTSPAENCQTLRGVEGVPIPHRASIALCRINESPSQTVVKTIPVAMIFEWAKTAGPPEPPRPGEDLLRVFLHRLGASPPAAGTADSTPPHPSDPAV